MAFSPLMSFKLRGNFMDKLDKQALIIIISTAIIIITITLTIIISIIKSLVNKFLNHPIKSSSMNSRRTPASYCSSPAIVPPLSVSEFVVMLVCLFDMFSFVQEFVLFIGKAFNNIEMSIVMAINYYDKKSTLFVIWFGLVWNELKCNESDKYH